MKTPSTSTINVEYVQICLNIVDLVGSLVSLEVGGEYRTVNTQYSVKSVGCSE